MPQHEEQFSPHLQSAEVEFFAESVFGDAITEPMANAPAKNNARIADFIL